MRCRAPLFELDGPAEIVGGCTQIVQFRASFRRGTGRPRLFWSRFRADVSGRQGRLSTGPYPVPGMPRRQRGSAHMVVAAVSRVRAAGWPDAWWHGFADAWLAGEQRADALTQCLCRRASVTISRPAATRHRGTRSTGDRARCRSHSPLDWMAGHEHLFLASASGGDLPCARTGEGGHRRNRQKWLCCC